MLGALERCKMLSDRLHPWSLPLIRQAAGVHSELVAAVIHFSGHRTVRHSLLALPTWSLQLASEFTEVSAAWSLSPYASRREAFVKAISALACTLPVNFVIQCWSQLKMGHCNAMPGVSDNIRLTKRLQQATVTMHVA